MNSNMSKLETRLFSPMAVGSTELAHRIVMAPLTRYRASDDHVPLPFVKDYYSQRGCMPGTLLITEATYISQRAGGHRNAPGIHNKEQIAAWKEVVDAVHAQGSKIYMQLWALGRSAKPDVARDEGFDIVSSSSVSIDSSGGFAVPRPLTEQEIWEWIGDFAQAARNAVFGAGFDGVEIHGANGYLVDQFTKDTCNRRTDAWGSSIENRSKFAYEVAKAVTIAVGPERTAIRLSPWGAGQGMAMEDPVPQFTDLIKRLSSLDLAYMHFLWRSHKDPNSKPKNQIQFAIDAWNKQSPVLISGWMTPESARMTIDETFRDKNIAIVFGRSFISNPDLVFRIQNDILLTEANADDFYEMKTPRGYIDYKFSKEWHAYGQNR